MLPFLTLVLLCGLLAQNTQGHVYPHAIANLSPDLLQHIITERLDKEAFRQRLQSLPLHQAVKNDMSQGNRGGLLSGLPLIGGLFGSSNTNLLGKVLGIKISKVELLSIDLQLDQHEKRFLVTLPADLELEVNLPLNLVHILHLKLFLDIQVGVRLFTDPATNLIRLKIENCQNTPGHIKVTLLKNLGILGSTLTDLVHQLTSVLEKTIPHLLQKELCPLANGLVQTVLDLLQGTWSTNVHKETVELSATTFVVHHDCFEIDYSGVTQLTGGQTVMIPPGSTPLPILPLEGSSMNLVLSASFMSTMVHSLLPTQAINLGAASQQEMSIFCQQITAVLPQNLRTSQFAIQVAYQAPMLFLKFGRIELRQSLEIKVYTQASHGDYQYIFTLQTVMDSLAGVSVKDGKLILTLGFERIESITLQNSSVGNFDVQHLAQVVPPLLSSSVLQHQNTLLAQGIPLPLVHRLDISHFSVAVGQDALKVFAPSH